MIVNNKVLFDSTFTTYTQKFSIVNKKREYYYILAMRKIDCCYMSDDNGALWLGIDKRKIQEISHKSVFYIEDLELWIKPKYFGGIHLYKNAICIEVEEIDKPEDIRE